jgi:hypothetical protein
MHDTFVLVLLFAPLLMFLLLNLYSVDILGRFLVATASSYITEHFTDTLLSFIIFFISRAKFSYFITSFVTVVEDYGSRELLYLLKVLLCSINQHYIRSVEIHVFVS